MRQTIAANVVFGLLFFVVTPSAESSAREIELFVNSPIGKSGPSEATDSPIGRSLLSVVDSAQHSLDVAIYGIRHQPEVFDAFARAAARGVTIRLVVDQNLDGSHYYSDTPLLTSLYPTVTDHAADLEKSRRPKPKFPPPYWEPADGFIGPPQCVGYTLDDNRAVIAVHASREPVVFEGDIMHNKFVVADGRRLWTGSCNVSDSGTGGYNANVAVTVDSELIAGWYVEEFERMFDGELFHHRKRVRETSAKRKTTLPSGETVEVGFSPQDRVYERIIRPRILSAEKSIDIAMFVFTHKRATADLIKAHARGVSVRMILDATAAGNEYTKHEMLRVAGIPVKVEDWGGKMHAKSAAIDGQTIVVGSMNWTGGGERDNDENTLVIDSHRLANIFQAAFEQMWTDIPDRWLQGRPDAESPDSPESVSDGIDNDFDQLIDAADPGCGPNPPTLPPLPPYRIVPLAEGYGLLKGNISANGTKIYHLPTDKYYNETRIDPSRGERWFASPDEAIEAGWRRANRNGGR